MAREQEGGGAHRGEMCVARQQKGKGAHGGGMCVACNKRREGRTEKGSVWPGNMREERAHRGGMCMARQQGGVRGAQTREVCGPSTGRIALSNEARGPSSAENIQRRGCAAHHEARGTNCTAGDLSLPAIGIVSSVLLRSV